MAQSANARNARMGRWYLRSLEEAAEPSRFVAWECARDPAAVAVAGRDLVLYVNPELQRLRALVDAARARLAELEAGFTIERAKVEAMGEAMGEEEAGKIAREYRQAGAQQEQEYVEAAAALAEQQELTAGEAAERMGVILRQGWAALDFGEERELAQLRRLWESIELEILRVLEAGHALKESPDYELHRLTTQTPAFFDETVGRHIESLEKELAVLESEAEDLAKEIEELTGERAIGSEGGVG